MATGLKGSAGRRRVGGSKPPSKGPAVAGRQRKEIDTSGYSGRLAQHLRSLVESKGLSIEKIAERAELPVSSVYAYLRGERGIPADVYPAMAKALGVTAAEFLPSFKAKK